MVDHDVHHDRYHGPVDGTMDDSMSMVDHGFVQRRVLGRIHAGVHWQVHVR